jgi:hypothetical protein
MGMNMTTVHDFLKMKSQAGEFGVVKMVHDTTLPRDSLPYACKSLRKDSEKEHQADVDEDPILSKIPFRVKAKWSPCTSNAFFGGSLSIERFTQNE